MIFVLYHVHHMVNVNYAINTFTSLPMDVLKSDYSGSDSPQHDLFKSTTHIHVLNLLTPVKAKTTSKCA